MSQYITRVKNDPEYALVDAPDKGYIWVKCDFVLKHMKGINIPLPSKDKKEFRSFQAAFHLLIKLDQEHADYRWHYKSEVTFSVPDPDFRKKNPIPAIPHLTQNRATGRDSSKGYNRRHTNGWSSRLVYKDGVAPKAYRRRPDLIIVKNAERRWPGGEVSAKYSVYNQDYADNIKRVVEMKFPNDSLSEEQEEDYQYIAGEGRFSVIHITEDDNQQEQEDAEYAFSPELAPVFAKERLPNPYKLERWVFENLPAIDLLGDVKYSRHELEMSLSKQTVDELENLAPWLFRDMELAISENGDGIYTDAQTGQVIKMVNKKDLDDATEYLMNDMDVPTSTMPAEANNIEPVSPYSTQDIQPHVVLEGDVIIINRRKPSVFSVLTTADKVVLALEIGATLALLIPGVNIAAAPLRAGLFLLRMGMMAKKANQVGRVAKIVGGVVPE